MSCWNPKSISRPPERGDDYTILQAFFSLDMLILFFATICGVGGTLTAIDNLGQIGSSLGYPKNSISTFVSLVSIWNYLGRVGAGFVSEHLFLWLAYGIIGFCFGPQWPLLFAIILELFGLKYYSTYNFGAVASPVGLYLLNVRVAGHLYDREAEK